MCYFWIENFLADIIINTPSQPHSWSSIAYLFDRKLVRLEIGRSINEGKRIFEGKKFGPRENVSKMNLKMSAENNCPANSSYFLNFTTPPTL